MAFGYIDDRVELIKEQLQGSATYKGDLMAVYRAEGKYIDKTAYDAHNLDPEASDYEGVVQIGNDFLGKYRKYIETETFNEKDGTIELKADFDKKQISGYFYSNTLGRGRYLGEGQIRDDNTYSGEIFSKR